MLKKFSSILLILIMITVITACGSSNETVQNDTPEETEVTEAKSGGWELYDNEANVLPDTVQEAFDKAAEKFTGSELKPLAYVASQVVLKEAALRSAQSSLQVDGRSRKTDLLR